MTMKTTRKELEIDFIGGHEPLTAQEEKSLSEYFKKKKNEKAIINKTVKVRAKTVN
jgi:hypothetical protein